MNSYDVEAMQRELDHARYILKDTSGILYRDGKFKVIVGGIQVGLWTSKRSARADLRQKRRAWRGRHRRTNDP